MDAKLQMELARIKGALMIERDALAGGGNLPAANAINDYLREATALSLIRLRDLLARVSA